MQVTAAERIAAILLALEGLALLFVAGWEVVALVGGDVEDVGSSIALIVLTVNENRRPRGRTEEV